MLKGDPLGEGSNAGSTNSELWRSGELIPKNEREPRRSEGSGMLMGDPLGEGSNAWLYQQRALGSGKLIPQNEATFRTLRRERHTHR